MSLPLNPHNLRWLIIPKAPYQLGNSSLQPHTKPQQLINNFQPPVYIATQSVVEREGE
ncbi:hypothetical protein J6590_066604 [Homalodisca vitripennis]|nr:hypothetical protein J6590_066604 [Homalodisca vitripennis]